MDELREPNMREESPQTKLQFVAVSESAADEIAAWTYAAPYTLYNHAPDQRAAAVRALLDASLRFSAITDEMGGSVGGGFRIIAFIQSPGGNRVEHTAPSAFRRLRAA